MSNPIKDELRNIISGKSQVRFGAIIQAATGYLEAGFGTSSKTENPKQVKEQEAKTLEKFISENNLWVEYVDFTQYVSEGAEQRVLLKDSEHVLKLNDSIYYNSWIDYFRNLLLHNYFFADTAYELLGFVKENSTLYAVVKQPYVSMTQNTDLGLVKLFLTSNGFIHVRNNDYFNPDLGIILEDLHDENVLTRNGILYFVDTVFYLTDQFWENK